MSKEKKTRPVLVMPVLPTPIMGNGGVSRLDKILHNKSTQDGYKHLLKEMRSNPEKIAEVLRATTWKGKTLDDAFSELEKD
jgi:hypothetical protein